MGKRLKSEIESLLAEDKVKSELAESSQQVRARLAANFSQGLGADDPQAGRRGPLSDDLAARAAFLDGVLGLDRAEFIATLAQDPSLRADVESTTTLLESVESAPSPVPSHPLERARAEFAPHGAPRAVPTPHWREWLFPWPRRRIAWAIVTTLLAIAVIAPGALLLHQVEWSPGGQPEQRTAGPQSDIEPATSCQDTVDAAPPDQRTPAQRGAQPNSKDGPSPGTTPDQPCAPAGEPVTPARP